ncbi:MAG: hypothetical protein AAFP85_07635 [Pseudomonadota bacterium]
MRNPPKPTSAIIGAAGEHFGMAELLRRGHIAALASQGAPNMGILIADERGQTLYSVQVKTRKQLGGDRGWHMDRKHESIRGDRLFYVFVDLGVPEGAAPSFFIIPADIVAETVRKTHAAWLRNPGRNGHTRKDSDMRRIRPDYTSNDTNEPVDPRYSSGRMETFRSAWGQFG